MAREMKDSRIAWIGEIPREWTVQRIKYLRNSEPDSFQDGDWIESPFITNEGIRYLTTGNVGDGVFKRQGDGYITEETFNELNCKFAFPNDLVISRLNAPYGRACILPSDEEKYVLAVDIVILRTDNDKRFLCYLMQCEGYQNVVQDGAKGTTMKRISRTNLGNVCVPIAPLLEQRRIADFLDAECTRIDAVIEKTRASIEEYKKLKQSVITQAVTKGIRPGRKMKDSGIEWMGEIPEEWECEKVFRIFKTIGSGTTPKSSDESYYDGSIHWIQSGDINGGMLTSTKASVTNEAIERFSALKIYDAPFIIIAMYGASIGNLSISSIDGCVNQACCVLQNGCQEQMYSFYAMKVVKDYLIWIAVGGGQPNISQETIKQLWLPMPPRDEQKEIVNFLNGKVAEVDKLIIKKGQLLAELESYKKSLIFEYVTGKKEVV